MRTHDKKHRSMSIISLEQTHAADLLMKATQAPKELPCIRHEQAQPANTNSGKPADLRQNQPIQ